MEEKCGKCLNVKHAKKVNQAVNSTNKIKEKSVPTVKTRPKNYLQRYLVSKMSKKKCTFCKKNKSLSEYKDDNHYTDNKFPMCLDCLKLASKGNDKIKGRRFEL